MEKIYQLVQDQFNKMVATGKLFRSSIPGSEIWSLYLQDLPRKKSLEIQSLQFTIVIRVILSLRDTQMLLLFLKT